VEQRKTVSRRKFIRETLLASAALAVGSRELSSLSVSQSKLWSEGIAAKYPNDEGIENDPDVLLFEGFESDGWSDRWQEISRNHRNYSHIETDTAIVLSGKRCLRLDFLPETGKDGAGWMHHWWDGSEVAYVRYYFRLSAGGNWANQKIMQLHGHMRGERYGTGAGNRPTGYDWFSTGTGVGGENGPPWTRVILYTYHPNQIGDYGDNVLPNQDLQPKIPEDEWVCYEFMIKLNNIGQANGEQRLWINGYLYIEQTGLEWRKHENMVINDLMQPTYTHTPPLPGQSRSLWLDSIVLAKKYIGPIHRNN